LKKDCFTGAITYGEGLGSYNVDLTQGRNDAALDRGGNLLAIPELAYYAGYTHYWTDNLKSTVVYSEVELDSVPSQGGFAYHRGRYAAANLAYRWISSNSGGKPAAVTFGLEYLYGQKETLNRARGEDQRLMLTVVLNGKP
jgi:hypothetical protein